jgi:hypothetical protein
MSLDRCDLGSFSCMLKCPANYQYYSHKYERGKNVFELIPDALRMAPHYVLHTLPSLLRYLSIAGKAVNLFLSQGRLCPMKKARTEGQRLCQCQRYRLMQYTTTYNPIAVTHVNFKSESVFFRTLLRLLRAHRHLKKLIAAHNVTTTAAANRK